MRVNFIIFVFITTWLILISRLFFLAVESNSYYSKLSVNNTIKTEPIPPVRGVIVDNKNRPLAINKLGFKIQLKPHLTQKKHLETYKKELDFILELLPSLDRKKIEKKYKKRDSYYNHNFIDIVDFVTYKTILPIYTKLNLRKNIKIIPAPKRYYPYKEIAAHAIGYVSRANTKDIKDEKLIEMIGTVGKTGIEKYYNEFLQGEAGYRKIKVNANNQEIDELEYVNAKEDKRLTLGIDIELQKYIAEQFKSKVGSVIVMDVNGSILSAGSYPAYDLNIFVSGMSHKMYKDLSSSLEHPFTNKMINGLYPPGSTIKIGLGLLYITTKLADSWSVDCKSSLPLGGRVFRCWKKTGHNHTNITKAIRESCDDFFYKGSLVVGNKLMRDGLMKYGLGKKTGIDLPNEFVGVVPSREWKRNKYNRSWNIGETLNTSIGQGDFLATPLQIAQLTALIATGKLPTPHIVKKIGDKLYEPQISNVLNEKELKKLPIIRRAMYDVCNHPKGTATKFISSKIRIAGKTGTAQVIGIKQDIKKRKLEHELSYYSRSHAWFTSYGPYKKPKYVVMALVEHGGHGGAAAGKIVSNIYNKLIELEYIDSK